MVLTRSKAAINYKELSDDELEERSMRGNGALKEESQSETRPKRKKAKISRSSRAAGGSKDRKTSRAGDPFTPLPLDTVYEIFGFLTPLELLQLSRTNKALRSFLMSKRSSIAWRSARAAATPPVLICPKDLSEPRLAVLLFTKDCTVCGKSPTQCQYVWYTLRLRACKPCFDSSVVFGRTAAQQYSYLDGFRTVLEVLPGENMFQRAQRRVSPTDDYYLVDELQKLSETVEQYQFRFEARVEGARQEFERLIEKIRSEASERIASAKTLREWTEQFQRLRIEAQLQFKEARKQEIISKLVDAGHDVRDVRQAASTYLRIPNLFWCGKPLTTAAWERIKPKAERFVEEQARCRLEAVEHPITRLRRSIFKQAYSTFKSSYNEFPETLVPSERYILKTHEGIKTVIETEGTDSSPTMFDNVFTELPDYVDRWRKERKLELTRLVLEAQIGPEQDIDLQAAEEQGILSLATSVFATCGYGDTFSHDTDTVHWVDSIGEHSQKKIYHTPSRKSPLSYDEMQCIRVLPNLVDHVKLLVQAVGLDPNTSTTAEMDKLDARFCCDDCWVVKLRGDASALSWRNCITHVGFHSSSKPWKGWTLLSPEDRAVVDRHEKSMTRGPGGRGRYKLMRCYRGRRTRSDSSD